MKSDLQLHVDVAEALRFDPRIDESCISVAVSCGVVTLTGTVPTYPELLAARETVKRLSGVRAFADDVSVDLPVSHRRDDTDIARAAADVLSRHSTLSEGFSVIVRDGFATLEGVVGYGHERDEAFAAISRLAGVRAVDNRITVARQRAGARP